MFRTGFLNHVILIAIGAIGGTIAYLLHVPLPWMIGSMVLVSFYSLAANPRPLPRPYRQAGQVIVGTAVALYLTQEAAIRIAGSWTAIFGSAILTIVAGCVVGLAQAKWLRMDMATAVFSSVPGGPTEMAILAEQHGGDPAHTALAQSFRILFVVLTFPPILLLGGGIIPPEPVVMDFSLPGFIAVFAIAISAGFLFARIGIINPFIMAPIIVVGALTAFGIHFSDVPAPVVYGGQVLLGTTLGTMFRREQLVRGRRMVGIATGSTIAMLAFCVGIAELLSVFTGYSLPTLVLSTAPGGVAEMAITAHTLNLDVSLVTTFHLVRICVVMLLIQAIYLLMTRFDARRPSLPPSER